MLDWTFRISESNTNNCAPNFQEAKNFQKKFLTVRYVSSHEAAVFAIWKKCGWNFCEEDKCVEEAVVLRIADDQFLALSVPHSTVACVRILLRWR